MARRGTGQTRTVRVYLSDWARLVARWMEVRAERPSVTLPDVIREALERAGYPAEAALPAARKRRRRIA